MDDRLEPVLDVHDIQGNILAGFSKDFQILVGLRITDVAGAKEWLRGIHPYVSSTYQVLHFNRLFRSIRARTKQEPVGLAATWFNLSFSHDGIAKLTSKLEADALPDDAFRRGMPDRAVPILGDPEDPASPYNPAQWKVGGPGNVPDVLLLIASDLAPMAGELLDHLMSGTGSASLQIVYKETGRVRSDLPGHEHFGFKDGISQPGARGRATDRQDDFITPRLIDPQDPLSADFSRPGQPLIMPGHFVLGYGTQDKDNGTVHDPFPLPYDWFKNGSFLAFRRLRQDVAAFRDFLRQAAESLVAQAGFEGLTPEVLGSIFVGRWPNGAPITRSPNLPTAIMAADIAANAFAFTNQMPSVRLRPDVPLDATPPAPGDPLAVVCPHWSHIRKVNPRDDDTNFGDEFDTRTRRFLRRGIPYGDPFPGDALNDDGKDRGLLFIAYHASLVESFERITQDWANQTDTPSPKGHDPVIGQTNAGDSRSRMVSVPSRTGAATVDVPIAKEWVFPTGGGYFFSPSLSALEGRLSQ